MPLVLEKDMLTNHQPQLFIIRHVRCQVFVDGKDFASAMKDYDSALSLSQESGVRARLHAGRALALEGVSDWRAALVEYDRALECARDAG